jgi:hypothetical protein
MYNLAQKCIQLKPPTGTHRLTGLLIGILEENTEVIVKRYCSCAIVFSFQWFGLATACFLILFFVQPVLSLFKLEWQLPCWNVLGCFSRNFQRIRSLVSNFSSIVNLLLIYYYVHDWRLFFSQEANTFKMFKV